MADVYAPSKRCPECPTVPCGECPVLALSRLIWDDENDDVGVEGRHDPALFVAAVRQYHHDLCGFDDAEITRMGYDFEPSNVEHVYLKPADDPRDDRLFLGAHDAPGVAIYTVIRGTR